MLKPKIKNPLIKQLRDAVNANLITTPFSAQAVEQWMMKYNIRKDNGEMYSNRYAATLLSDSLIKDRQTKNRNSRWLKRRKTHDGTYEYWFAEQ